MRKPTPKTPKHYDSLKPKLDVHEAITAKIVEAIQAGAGTFEMPWHRPGVALSLPKNAATDKAYRGSNVLSLWIDADAKKFEHQVWATFKQWLELEAPVRKGEKGSLIVKYGEWVPKNADGKAQPASPADSRSGSEASDEEAAKRLYAKAAWVFNVDQVDASAELRQRLLPAATPRPDLTVRLDAVDRFVAAVGINIREGGQSAFYRHRDLKGEGDFIQMPPRELFTGTATSTPTEAYYSTLLHEEIHGSGAAHRLNRQFGERFGDHAYAFEELVAELGAAFLCAHLEVTNTPRIDHAQYIAGWLEALKGDTKAIFTAASLATKAVDYLCGLQPGTKPDPSADHDDPGDGASNSSTNSSDAASPQRPDTPERGSDHRGGPSR